MAEGTELKVNLVSATQQVWEGTARMVVARTVEGELGILPGREPVLAILAEGQVRITDAEGNETVARADDGFLSVANNVVTIVAREASLTS